MKTADCDILIIPGWQGSGPNHWQTRWQARLPTARRVEQSDWDRPDRISWGDAIVAAAESCRRPVVLVAHSLGVAAVVHAAPRLPASVAGAFLVAVPDVDAPDLPAAIESFAGLPTAPLPFPSLLIASRGDPWCRFERAEDLGAAWGSDVIDAGLSGHINSDSGHGPWPEGLTRFATLLKRI